VQCALAAGKIVQCAGVKQVILPDLYTLPDRELYFHHFNTIKKDIDEIQAENKGIHSGCFDHINQWLIHGCVRNKGLYLRWILQNFNYLFVYYSFCALIHALALVSHKKCLLFVHVTKLLTGLYYFLRMCITLTRMVPGIFNKCFFLQNFFGM